MNNYRNNKFTQNYCNLIISSDLSFWDGKEALFDRERFLESTYGNRFEKNNQGEHDNYLKELKAFPCLFLYEKQFIEREGLNIMGYIGHITSCQVVGKFIKINFEKENTISLNDVMSIADTLEIGRYELNRTHWAVKNLNLYDVINTHAYLLENKNLFTKPRVFFSYSWEIEETSKIVEFLYNILKENGIEVVFDKADLHVGHNMDYFMESVRRDEFDKVYCFCDKSYIDKANNLQAGVGTETNLLRHYVKNNPTQSKVIPLYIDGTFASPIFLSGIKGINLSPNNWNHGVQEVIDDIFRQYR